MGKECRVGLAEVGGGGRGGQGGGGRGGGGGEKVEGGMKVTGFKMTLNLYWILT